MKNLTFLSAKEKENCVVRYKAGESIQAISKEYDVTERSIRRWCSKYDRTTESLKNGSPKLQESIKAEIKELNRGFVVYQKPIF